MLNIFNYNLSINLNPYLLVLLAIIVVGYVAFIYKYTIPQTSQLLKIVLISVRSIVLVLLLMLIFEPSLTVTNTEKHKPIIPVFIDNSSSIVDDNFSFQNKIRSLVKSVPTSEDIEYEFYIFSGDVTKIGKDSVMTLSNNGALTNFQKIFEKLKSDERYITSAVIISDGIINDGSSSIYEAEELKLPLYTIGVGDTTKVTDVYINNILNRNPYRCCC
jgi:hypothetical protein